MTPHDLTHRREGLGLSIPGLADVLNRSRVTVWRWESGAIEIPDWLDDRLEKIERLHRLLTEQSVLEKESAK
jgi:DNA-binding transcriptional regulator YiaG